MSHNDKEPVDINVFNKISPEQLAAEEAMIGPISETLSRGSKTTYYKSSEYMYSQIFTKYLEKFDKELEEIEPRLKYMTPEEIIQEDNIRRATCKLCGMICQSEAHMLQHKGLLRCRKQQAKNKGEVYVAENKQPVHCDICDTTVQRCNWVGHIGSQAHRINVIIKDGRAFNCPICDQNFTGNKRPKKSLKDHLCRKKHLKKLSCPKNRDSHDALIKLYNFKMDTTKLLKEIGTSGAKPPRPLPSSADREKCVPCPASSSTAPEREDHCKVAKGMLPQPRVLEV